MAGGRHGGAEAFFTRLAVAFQDENLTQKVAVRPYPERIAALQTAGVPVLPMAFGGAFDLFTRARLRQALRDFAPDVVLAWMNRAAAYTPPGDYLRIGRLGGYYNLKYYRGFDHLIGNTPDITDYIVDAGWDRARVHYLPNFVEIAPSAPASREACGTPAGAPLALMLGRLHPNKAVDTLVAALARCPGVYLWISGEGPERAKLEAQTRAAGLGDRVRFLGWRQDVSALLAACDILVCPSRHEPLGNVVLEGWAAAKPVVAAASQGPAALIAHEKTGLLVPVDDAEALAAALNRVTQDKDLAAALASAGHAAYTAGYTREAVVTRYLALFQSLTIKQPCAG